MIIKQELNSQALPPPRWGGSLKAAVHVYQREPDPEPDPSQRGSKVESVNK